MEDETDVIDWAAEAAAQVMVHVERHGVAITWSEAYRRVLVEAGLGPLRMVDADGNVVPFGNPLGRHHPDFAEAVACTHVHWHWQVYHPTRPDSDVRVGIFIHTLVEALSRLAFLLQLEVTTPEEGCDISGLAALVASLGSSIGEDWLMDTDEGPTGGTLDGCPYMILAAREVWAAITYLESGTDLLTRLDEFPNVELPCHLAVTLIDSESHHACATALRWWLGIL